MHTVIFTFVWMGPGSNFLTKVYCEKFSHTQWYTVVHPDLELMGGGGGGVEIYHYTLQLCKVHFYNVVSLDLGSNK